MSNVMNFILLNNQWGDGVLGFGQDWPTECFLVVIDIERLCLGLLQVL